MLSGTLHDPYTGTVIVFFRGRITSVRVQIDHVVALSDAWQKGAQQWSTSRRTAYANDSLNLLAVDGPTNGRKSDGDAATWLPPNKAYRCSYAARQVAVKVTYGLWVTSAERDALARILASPFGAAMAAVRENEGRARACGYDVRRVRWQAFTLSGAFTGLAGALYALKLGIVPIDSMDLGTSGLAVIMALLGGSGTFFGPFVGALVFVATETLASGWTEHWPLVVGALFMACVLFFPRGVWGTLLGRLPRWA